MNNRFLRAATALGVVAITGAAIAGALRAHAASAPSVNAPPDARTVAAAHWLGRASLPALAWKSESDAAGRFYRAFVPDVGSVDLDATSLNVRQAIFEGQLRGSKTHVVGQSAAVATALRFAQAHYAPGLSDLVQRSVALVDHGTYQEYRVDWQARQGDAWLPSQVMLGINADTGAVAYYWARTAALTISPVPAVGAQQAANSARSTAALANASLSTPSLEVVLTPAGQRLVWITEVHGIPAAVGPHVAGFDVVWTDAQTGASQIVARS